MRARAACDRRLLFLLLLALGGCSQSDKPNKAGDPSASPSSAGETKRVILLTNGPDPFWSAMYAGMQAAEKDFDLAAAGLHPVMDVNDSTEKGQIDKLRQYANQTDIAAVAVSVTNPANAAIARAMSDLQEQGIQVIAIDSDVDRTKGRSARFAYLGTDNVLGGQELGKAAKGIRPDGGPYATFVGLKGAANAMERIRGFGEGAGQAFNQVENLGDGMDPSTAQKNVRDALDRHSDLTTLVGIWAYNAHAIVETVKNRKLRDKVTIVVFDAAPKAIHHMQEGLIDAMVVQDPYDMGYRGTRLMKALVQKDQKTIKEILPAWDPDKKEFSEPDGDLVVTGLRVVYPNQKSPLKKEMFAGTTEFLSLAEFKKWLADHGLTGS